jgi:rubrerythrin
MTLADLLRLAYSAERAAAYAYQGHAAAVSDSAEKARIRAIEQEEWQHRTNILRILTRMGLRPSPWLEFKYALIGTLISLSCHVIGRFMATYFAGRLESGNVNEYIRMVELSAGTAVVDEQRCLQEMARVEKEHELYFLSCIATHRLMPIFQRLFGWGPSKCFNALVIESPARP